MHSFMVKLSLWIHRHYETGQPVGVDFFSIGGENISLDFIRWLQDPANSGELLQAFAYLKPERCYNALCEVTPYFGDGFRDEYNICMISYVEDRTDEALSSSGILAEVDLLGWIAF